MALRFPRRARDASSGDGSRRAAEDPFLRYGAAGVQFAATILAFTALGWWLDGKWGTSPWLLLLGAALGFTGAMISLVRTVPPVEDHDHHHEPPSA